MHSSRNPSSRRRTSVAALSAGALLVLALAAASSSTAGRDRQPSRIVAAALQDANHDSRADRLRLTYSEQIKHLRDADGAYPFKIAGYRIRSVGASAGKVIVISLGPAAGPRSQSLLYA
jgi:hypothetical protein